MTDPTNECATVKNNIERKSSIRRQELKTTLLFPNREESVSFLTELSDDIAGSCRI